MRFVCFNGLFFMVVETNYKKGGKGGGKGREKRKKRRGKEEGGAKRELLFVKCDVYVL